MRKNHNKKNSSSLNQNLLGSNVQMTDLDTNNRNNPYISTDFDNNEILYGKKDLKNPSLILKSKMLV